MGKLYASKSAVNNIPKDFYPPARQWYINAKSVDEPVISDPYIDTVTGNPCITVSVKITAQDGTIGVICVDYNLITLRNFLDNSKDKEQRG